MPGAHGAGLQGHQWYGLLLMTMLTHSLPHGLPATALLKALNCDIYDALAYARSGCCSQHVTEAHAVQQYSILRSRRRQQPLHVAQTCGHS